MILLLDTHVLLWIMDEPERIPQATRELIGNSAGKIYVSVVTLWELAIKDSLGKLDLPVPYEELNKEIFDSAGMELLPLRPEHVSAVRLLPYHHKDPFDRMLVAQAQIESMGIVTADPLFSRYSPPVIW